LFVAVTDAIWLQHLTFYQSQLLQKIRHVLGEVPISRLHFTLASSSQPPMLSGPEEVQEPTPLTAEEERQVQEGTAGIADPDLREVVRRAWRQGWQARR
jgi:hypothetical protein